MRRLGDNGQLVLLQLIGADESKETEKPTKEIGKKHSKRKAKLEPEQTSDTEKAVEIEEIAEIQEPVEPAEDIESEETNESEDQNEKNQ
jgi:hypothetical protein